MDGQGNLERTWQVREKSGKLKIDGSLQKIIYSVQNKKGCTFSLGEQILSFKSSPQI